MSRNDDVRGVDEPDEGREAEQLFNIGEVVRRWIITGRIGGGAFGETYTAVDAAPEANHMEVCIKAEKQDKRPILRTEVLALKRAQDCPNVVRYISSGKFNNINFLVMEKLGENLAEVRRKCARGITDLYSAIKYTIACLNCIEQVHNAGLIHRDIKPSNFVLGKPGSPPYTVFIIDFGLAKRYVSSNGEIKPPRDNAGFRGTSRYASINSHLQKDLGRVDDLWSLLFMSIEFITGTLPWRRVKDKDAIGTMKQQQVGPQLVKFLPREMADFLQHLQTLDYADRPNYEYLRDLLNTTITRKNLMPPPIEPAPAPTAAQAPAISTGSNQESQPPAAAAEDSAPRNRSRGVIMTGGDENIDVILHLQSPMQNAKNDGAKITSRVEEEEGAASPVNLEMGSIAPRSGAVTPSQSILGGLPDGGLNAVNDGQTLGDDVPVFIGHGAPMAPTAEPSRRSDDNDHFDDIARATISPAMPPAGRSDYTEPEARPTSERHADADHDDDTSHHDQDGATKPPPQNSNARKRRNADKEDGACCCIVA